MEDVTNQPLEQLVQHVRARELPRDAFIKIVTGLGASASGAALLLASAETASAARLSSSDSIHHRHAIARHHEQLHHAHVQRQGGATQPPGGNSAGGTDASVHAFRAEKLSEIMRDYADHAIVEDPLFDRPIAGKQAIAERKIAEMTAMQGVSIEVTRRFAHNNQVVAEWILRGNHVGTFKGFAPTGRSIELRGMTVVTREGGKIVKESLFYDVSELQRQLG